MKRLRELLTSSAVAILLPGVALAQDASQSGGGATQEQAQGAEAEPPEGQDIVVTGSRIAQTGFSTPVPVTATTNEQLQLASPTTISDALNELPLFRGSIRPQNAGSSVAGNAGASQLNLRNLGTNRLLVLLNGQRVIASGLNGGVDVALLPNLLVDRVDVVTGGASAAYGSDAVAGVVNYILDTDYEGIKGGVQAGISEYGDAASHKFEIAGGTSFAGGRGHILASAEYYNMDAIGPYEGLDRRWVSRGAGVIPNPAGPPARLFLTEGVTLAGLNPAGIITTGPLRGTTFNPDGTPRPFQYGQFATSLFMVGGDGVFQDMDLTGAIQRQSYFGRVDYDVTDNVKLIAEGSYGRTYTPVENYYWLVHSSSAFTIFSDNAYMDPGLRARMAQAGVNSFTLGRMLTENPFVRSENTSKVMRGRIGFEADLAGLKIEGSYIRQKSTLHVLARDVPKIRNMYAAADAVVNPATGQIVCRSTLMGYDPGCVPLNLFGVGAPSQAALDYIVGDHFRRATITEDNASLSVSGPLFKLWSDAPVAFAAGVEYRKDKGQQTADALGSEFVSNEGMRGLPASFVNNPGGYVIANFKPLQGAYNVKEAFLEINAPLISDQTMFEDLTINGALRYADYSTSGGVTSWKVGLNYMPIQDLRFRATRSRDVRGPNFVEYFSPLQNSGTTDVFDPRIGKFVNSLGLISGNPNLNPERADTLTFGAVLQPSFIPRLSFSVDYWSIKISGAISSLSAQDTVNECAAGSAVSCSNIIDLGNFYRILRPSLNLANTDTRGIDFELGYAIDIGSGRLSLRGLATYLDRFRTRAFASAPVIDRTGQVGLATNPKWSVTGQATYTNGPFTAFFQQRYISSGTYDATFREGIEIDHNYVRAAYYSDLTLKMRVAALGNGEVEMFGSVENLFNAAPPLAPQVQSSLIPASNYAMYDPIGRYFTLGFRASF